MDSEHPIRVVPPPAKGKVQTGGRPAPTPGGAVDSAEFLVHDRLRVLYRRRWTIVTVFVAIVAIKIAWSFTTTPVYEATAQLLIEKESSNIVNFKEAVEQNQAGDDYYQTQYRILQSRGLARRTIASLKLWDDSRWIQSEPSTISEAFDRSFAWMASKSSGRVPGPEPPAPETAAESAIISAFVSQLRVTPVRTSRLVNVTFSSTAPERAAVVVNGLSRVYIEQNLEYKFLASREASDWLRGQLAEQRKLVEASELALQLYREQADAMSLEERQNIVVQKLEDLNAAVTRVKTDRIQKEAAYNQIIAVQRDRRALDTIPAVLSNVFIQQQKNNLADLQRQQGQLAEKLGPNHPDMVTMSAAIRGAENRIQEEINKIVQAIRNDYQAAMLEEGSLTAALEQQKKDALALNRKGIDYGALQRDAATNRQIFESLLQRAKETGISGELRTNNIRVVDAAEPPTNPVTPNLRRDLYSALWQGLFFAIVLVFCVEYLDNRIKSPNEITEYLNLPFLGMVPNESPNVVNPLLTITSSRFVESFRSIRTNVLFSSTEESCRSLVVTSTGPGEGKTMVASNLSIALAHAGQRVLLIDADMRKPRVHEMFGRQLEPGLSNVLVGKARLSESVGETSTSNLWVLPAGRVPPNAAELLGSTRFRELLMAMGGRFDYVIIDTPPLMAVTDASLVSNLVTGVVYVVGNEMTSRQVARRSLEYLTHAKAHLIGAVLNRVNIDRHAYYYAPYYRSEYTSADDHDKAV